MPRLLSVLALAALALPVPSSAQAFRTDSGTAEFTSSVPLHSFTGTSDRLAGRIDLGDGTVDFFLDLETLETGIGKRDKDMRKTLETDEYPFASFYGRFLAPVDSTSYAEQPVRVTGAFSIHGVEREIGLDGTVQRTAEGLRIRAEWILKLTDYDIVPPRLLIVKVDEVQRLRIDALLTPETP
jgi:polyisoprenoid-binding protein YceI